MKFNDTDFLETFWTIKDGDFYVSTIGDDSIGDGSPKKPFHTIGRALDYVEAGEKVVIDQYQYDNGSNTEFAVSSSRGSLLNVKVATLAQLPLNGLPAIDDYQIIVGDRILVWNQNRDEENGIYLANAGTWNRDKDFDHGDKLVPGMLIAVEKGVQYGNEIFQLNADFPVTIGNSILNFKKIAKVFWGDIQGNISDQRDVILLIDNQINALRGNPSAAGNTLEKLDQRLTNLDQTVATESQLIDSINELKGGVPQAGDNLDKLYQLIRDKVGVSARADDLLERNDSKHQLEDQQNIYVEDASADPTVNTGWAIYKYLAQPDEFVKIAEQESIDLQILNGGAGIIISDHEVNLGGAYSKNIDLQGSSNSFVIQNENDQTKGIWKMDPSDLQFQNSLDISSLDDFNIVKSRFGIRSDGKPLLSFSASINDGMKSGAVIRASNDLLRFNLRANNQRLRLDMNAAESLIITDDINAKGASYSADYNDNNINNPRWIPDKEYVDTAVDNISIIPSGQNGEFQFNNNGSLGATSNFKHQTFGKTFSLSVSNDQDKNASIGLGKPDFSQSVRLGYDFDGAAGSLSASVLQFSPTETLSDQTSLLVEGGSQFLGNTTNPAVEFRAFGYDFDANPSQVALTNRPLFSFVNNHQKVAEVKASGDWDYKGNSLKNVANPVEEDDVATKAYVDDAVGMINSAPINNFLSGITFNTSSGVLSLARSGLSSVSVDLDGRYLTNNQSISLNGQLSGSGSRSINAVLTSAAISGQTTLNSGLTANDQLLVNDSGTLKKMNISVLQSFLQSKLVFAAASHKHSASDINSGKFADARISSDSVRQHQASLSIGWDQVYSAPSLVTNADGSANYKEDYSINNSNNPRWIPDKEYVDRLSQFETSEYTPIFERGGEISEPYGYYFRIGKNVTVILDFVLNIRETNNPIATVKMPFKAKNHSKKIRYVGELMKRSFNTDVLVNNEKCFVESNTDLLFFSNASSDKATWVQITSGRIHISVTYDID